MSRLEPLTAAQLREIPLLRDVPAEARELLRPLLSLAHFDKDERIANAGAYLDGAYYLLKGTVDVRMPAAAGQPGVQGGTIVIEDLPISVRAGARTSIEAGTIFGEGSALSRYPLAADFDAATGVTCLLIRTAALRAMFDLAELAAFKAAFDRDYNQTREDRFTRGFTLDPGRQRLAVSMGHVIVGPQSRTMDVQHMKGVRIFSDSSAKGKSVLLERLYLK